jgi:hypothetical protein
VIAGIEKENRNPWIERDPELCQQHVLGLKAASEAHVPFALDLPSERGAHMLQLRVHF